MRRRDGEDVGRRRMETDPPGRGKRRRPKRFMNALKEDVQMMGVTKEDAEDRGRWRRMTRCCDL